MGEAGLAGDDPEVEAGILDLVAAGRPRPDLEEERVLPAPVLEAVAVGVAGPEAGAVAGAENLLARVGDERHRVRRGVHHHDARVAWRHEQIARANRMELSRYFAPTAPGNTVEKRDPVAVRR
jgi:hypothetical protein